MRIVRYRDATGNHYGILREDEIYPYKRFLFENCDSELGKPVSLESVRLLCPVEPGKILAIGFNYRDHAKELGREIPKVPNVFQKPVSCLVGCGDSIFLPRCFTQRVEYEGEMVIVIGRRAHHVSVSDALQTVLGYTCGNDVSARDLQSPTNQWTVCKGFDTFGPVGPWIETELDPFNASIETRVNGVVKQHSNTRELIFDVPTLISYLSDCMTLMPGDLIFTGTPFGVSPLSAGDQVEVEIGGIGILKNQVMPEPGVS